MPLKLYSEKDDRPRSTIKNIIAVAAGKGGVGKSSVTVNLALALIEKGLSVGILDADLYGPSIRRMLPEDRLPSQRGEFLFPALCRGIPIISMAYFRQEREAAIVRAPIANGVIKQFLDTVVWGELDVLLIDFPPGTGDIQLTLSQKANLAGAVIVTTPQEISLIDVRKTVHMFRQLNVPIMGVIENMSYYLEGDKKIYLFGQGGGERLAREEGVPFLGAIPIDPAICQCGDSGTSLLEKSSSGAQAFRVIRDPLLKQIVEVKIPNLITKLNQIDSHSFSIEWHDGVVNKYNLNELQKKCPCAGCKEEGANLKIKPDVEVRAIHQVGRYALRIDFSTGCSAGIYTFDMLKIE